MSKNVYSKFIRTKNQLKKRGHLPTQLLLKMVNCLESCISKSLTMLTSQVVYSVGDDLKFGQRFLTKSQLLQGRLRIQQLPLKPKKTINSAAQCPKVCNKATKAMQCVIGKVDHVKNFYGRAESCHQGGDNVMV